MRQYIRQKTLLFFRYKHAPVRKDAMAEVENRIMSIRIKGESANPADVRKKAKAAGKIPDPVPVPAKRNKPPPPPTKPKTGKPPPPAAENGDSDVETPEMFDNNFFAYQQDKMKAVFA